MTERRRRWLLGLGAALLWGCNSVLGFDDYSVGQPCSVPNDKTPCSCADGRSGQRSCRADLTYGDCSCDEGAGGNAAGGTSSSAGGGPSCSPGQSAVCECPGGKGLMACDGSGHFGACQCSVSAGGTGGSGATGGTGGSSGKGGTGATGGTGGTGGTSQGCGVATGLAACDACMNAHCCSQAQSCASSPCLPLLQCVQACSGNSACTQSCFNSYPAGTTPLQNLGTCINNACPNDCGSGGTGGSSGTGGTGGSSGTGGTGGASCCSPHDTASCSDAKVSACVCANDAFCCSNGWDETCVGDVAKFGCGGCGAGGTGGSGGTGGNPFGGTGGSGGSGAGGNGPPGAISCGDLVCSATQGLQCCRPIFNPDPPAACYPVGASCPSMTFTEKCDGPEDCPQPGSRCCMTVNFPTVQSQCAPSCSGSTDRTLCHTDADCPFGSGSCKQCTQGNLSFGVCGGC